MEVGITCGRLLASVETTKGRKYEPLAGELRSMFPGVVVNLIPIVLSWVGRVAAHFKRHAKALGISKDSRAYLQCVSLKKTRDTMVLDIAESQSLEE